MDIRLAVIDGQLEVLEQQERQLLDLVEAIRMQKSKLYSERNTLCQHPNNGEWLVPDILLIIFRLVVDDQDEYTMTAPLIISHVCRSWRRIAIAQPSLWSKLVIGLGDYKKNVELLQLYLTHAKDVAPSYIIGAQLSSKSPDAERLKDHAGKIIELNRHRCSDLSWSCDNESMTELFLTILGRGDPFPQLTSLLLGFDSSIFGLSRSWPQQSRGTDTFPALRSLVLREVHFEHLPIDIYRHLCILDLSFTESSGDIYMSHFRTVFAETVGLEELTLSNCNPILDMTLGEYDSQELVPGRWAVNSSPPIPLSKLTKLSWCHPPIRAFYVFFLFFPTPCVEKLELTLDNMCNWQDGANSHTPRITPRTLVLSSTLTFGSLSELEVRTTSPRHLCRIFEKMEFPKLRSIDLGPVLDKVELDEHELAFPSVDSIFREPRLSQLTRLTLSSLALDPGIQSFLAYAPHIEHLSFCSCADASIAICLLSPASCHCKNSTRTKKAGSMSTRLCSSLSTIEFVECNDLDFKCLKTLVLDRNIRGGDRIVRGLDLTTADRRIKPLWNRHKKAQSSVPTHPADPSLGGGLRPEPVMITQIKFFDCHSISDTQAVELREFVNSVVWTQALL
jgi:F-box-like